MGHLYHSPSFKGPGIITEGGVEKLGARGIFQTQQGLFTHELTVPVTTNTRSSQTKSQQEWRGAHEVPS